MSIQRWAVRGLMPVVIGVSLLAGCADSGSDGGGSSADGSSDPEEARLAYTKCMREHGVDIPDPKPGGGMIELGPGGSINGNHETFKTAQEACSEYLDDMGEAGTLGQLTEEDKEQMLKFAECMREHGIDIPDPDFNSDGGGMDIPLDSVASDKLKAAEEACQEFFGPPEGTS